MDEPPPLSRPGIVLTVLGVVLLAWGFGRPTCPSLGFSMLNAGTAFDCGGPDPFLMWLLYTILGAAMFLTGILLLLGFGGIQLRN
jgi:Ca2+/Na+ antiporter